MKTPDSKDTDEALAYTQAFVDKWKGDELVASINCPSCAEYKYRRSDESDSRVCQRKSSSYYAPCF